MLELLVVELLGLKVELHGGIELYPQMELLQRFLSGISLKECQRQ
jgi:hypothetical protein